MPRSLLLRSFLASSLFAAVAFLAYCGVSPTTVTAARETAKPDRKPQTQVAIVSGFWEINGKPTYEGSTAEGLLLNVRMAQAVFQDNHTATCPKGFDADENTKKFIAALPKYVESGVLAFTINLQGGDPGYEGARNLSFDEDGKIGGGGVRRRTSMVIEACDKLGAVVILTCFHWSQDQRLANEAAVRRAVTEVSQWIQKEGYTNVILEIADEYPRKEYDHDVIRTPDGVASLISLARKTAPKLLVSSSSGANGRIPHDVGNASSFYMLHFDGVPLARIGPWIVKASKSSKVVVCNQDAKTGEEGAKALEETVNGLASWGYRNLEKNEHWPFEWDGAEDDPIVYAKMAELTRAD